MDALACEPDPPGGRIIRTGRHALTVFCERERRAHEEESSASCLPRETLHFTISLVLTGTARGAERRGVLARLGGAQ